MSYWIEDEMGRRTFVRSVLGIAGAMVVGGCARAAGAYDPGVSLVRSPLQWRDHMGLQLYTVRDQIEKDFGRTLAQVAAAGHKEAEPPSYAGPTPAQGCAVPCRTGLV